MIRPLSICLLACCGISLLAASQPSTEHVDGRARGQMFPKKP